MRDDEIAASLAGPARRALATLAFTLSAAAAGLGGGLLAVVTGTVAPGAFPIQLSLTLLAGVVIGGLGSLVGAVWGAALLVLLPNWTNDLASSFSLSTNVVAQPPARDLRAGSDRRDAGLADGYPGGLPSHRAVGPAGTCVELRPWARQHPGRRRRRPVGRVAGRSPARR